MIQVNVVPKGQPKINGIPLSQVTETGLYAPTDRYSGEDKVYYYVDFPRQLFFAINPKCSTFAIYPQEGANRTLVKVPNEDWDISLTVRQ